MHEQKGGNTDSGLRAGPSTTSFGSSLHVSQLSLRAKKLWGEGKKIHFSPASPLSISLYICFKIQTFIKKLIEEWCWSGALPSGVQDLHVVFKGRQSASPAHLCPAHPLPQRVSCSLGLSAWSLQDACRAVPASSATSTMPASAAAVEHLEEMWGLDFRERSQPKENGTADCSFQHELPCMVTKVQLMGHMQSWVHLLLLLLVLGENSQWGWNVAATCVLTSLPPLYVASWHRRKSQKQLSPSSLILLPSEKTELPMGRKLVLQYSSQIPACLMCSQDNWISSWWYVNGCHQEGQIFSAEVDKLVIETEKERPGPK